MDKVDTGPDGQSANDKPKRVLVDFKTFVIVGSATLSILSAGSSGVSAYFASQEKAAALASVNTQSKNEAFAGVVKAHKAICAISLGKADQIKGATWSEGEGPGHIYIDYDALRMDITDKDLDDLYEVWLSRNDELNDELDYYRIWASNEEYQNTVRFLPEDDDLSYQRQYLKDMKRHPQASIAVSGWECQTKMRDMISVYKNADNFDYDFKVENNTEWDYIPIPYSEKRRPEDIMVEWQMNEELEYLKKSGEINVDDDSEKTENSTDKVEVK